MQVDLAKMAIREIEVSQERLDLLDLPALREREVSLVHRVPEDPLVPPQLERRDCPACQVNLDVTVLMAEMVKRVKWALQVFLV